MISIVLAAFSAGVWGAADFCGGKAAQRASALVVSVLSKLASLPVLAVYLVLLPGHPAAGSLAWGLLGGFAGMVGLILFYRALSAGAMVVVAPVSAVTAAVVPMIIGLLIERIPPPTALVGAGCAVVSIALVSAVPTAGARVVTPSLIGWSLTAGAGFGVFSVLLNQAARGAGGGSGLWPIVGTQAGALVLGAALLIGTRAAPRLPVPSLRWAVTAGILDMTANALLLLAVRGGLLSIVAPLSAMYPASTVLLARTVDREPIRAMQLVGLGLAALALVLVAS